MKRTPLLLAMIAGLLSLTGALTAQAGAKLLGANVRVDDGNRIGKISSPAVAAANGATVYAVWLDDRRTYDEPDVIFAKSNDGGATWGANVNVSNGLDNEIGLDDPAVASHPGGAIFVVWFNPYPGFDGCQVGAATYETCIYMARSDNGGASFSRWTLWGSNDANYTIEPQLAIDPVGGDMVVAASDRVGTGAGGENIYGLVWNDAAGQWRSQVVNDIAGSATSSSSAMDGSRMAVATRNNVSYVAWEDARNGGTRIYGDRTTVHGQTWGADFAISPAGVNVRSPRLALAPDGKLYAAYATVAGLVYLRRSTDGGQTWSTPIAVSVQYGAGGELGAFDLAVDGNGTVAVVWNYGNWDTGVSDLWLSTSIDGGATFTRVKVEDDPTDVGGQYGPAVAATGSGDNGRAVMIWLDDRNASNRIWSARAELDATPPTAPNLTAATPGDTVVDLSWTAATDRNGILGYYVARAAQSGGALTVRNPRPITGTTYRDVGLASGAYYYKVFAVDGTGNLGPVSNERPAVVVAGTDLPVTGVIAFESGNQLHLRDLPALGNARSPGAGNQPVFAGNGQRVYFYANASHAIRSMNTSAGDMQTFYANANLHGEFDIARSGAGLAAWIENKHYVQYCGTWDVFEPHFGVAPASQYTDIYELADDPAISADSRWFAYTSVGYTDCYGPHPYTHSALTLRDSQAAFALTGFYDDANYQGPAFAPTTGWLAFAADLSGQYELWKAQVQADGTLANFAQLTHGAAGVASTAPAWSSDGNWLIFQRDIDPGAGVNLLLHIVRADGSALRTLGLAGMEPAWFGGDGASGDGHALFLPMVRK